jgi:hypothetical protein
VTKGWLALLVRSCTASVEQIGAGNGLLKKDEAIKRTAGTLLRGKVERLHRSDESARAIVASRLLNDPSAPPASKRSRK